jgi:hypothetical protein
MIWLYDVRRNNDYRKKRPPFPASSLKNDQFSHPHFRENRGPLVLDGWPNLLHLPTVGHYQQVKAKSPLSFCTIWSVVRGP